VSGSQLYLPITLKGALIQGVGSQARGKVWRRQCLILGGAAWRRDVGRGKGQVHMLLAELGSKGNYNLIDPAGQMGGRKGVMMLKGKTVS
jgi:hypothetical protein